MESATHTGKSSCTCITNRNQTTPVFIDYYLRLNLLAELHAHA